MLSSAKHQVRVTVRPPKTNRHDSLPVDPAASLVHFDVVDIQLNSGVRIGPRQAKSSAHTGTASLLADKACADERPRQAQEHMHSREPDRRKVLVAFSENPTDVSFATHAGQMPHAAADTLHVSSGVACYGGAGNASFDRPPAPSLSRNRLTAEPACPAPRRACASVPASSASSCGVALPCSTGTADVPAASRSKLAS